MPPMVLTHAAEPRFDFKDVKKPSAVERMEKHFAEVLRNAEVMPVPSDDAIGLSKQHMTSEAREAAVAAREVAEQLSIAEAAEARARALDRRAAEEHGNETALAKLTIQEALNAGAAAAHKKANALL